MKDYAPAEWIVVVNEERRYALMPAGIAVPRGWTATGDSGSEEECVTLVDGLVDSSRAAQ